jgi:hypothetical protein
LSEIENLDIDTIAKYFEFAKDRILTIKKGITDAPGADGKVFYVADASRKPPAHFDVTVYKTSGRVTCEKQRCPYFAIHDICPEIVALVIEKGLVNQFVAFMNYGRNTQRPTKGLDRLINTNLPANSGTKNQSSTARRKGDRHRPEPITGFLDGPSGSGSKRPIENATPKKSKRTSNEGSIQVFC